MASIDMYFNAKDGVSQSLKTMQQNAQRANKDLKELQTEIAGLSNKKVDVKTNFKNLQNELRDMEKNARKTGQALGEEFKTKTAEAMKLEQELKDINQQIKENERATRSLNSVQAGSVSGGSSGSTPASGAGGSVPGGFGGTISSLAQAGLFKQVGDAVAGAASVGISSAFGSSNGNAINSILSGAAAGAALGSIIPGIGTAVGAAVGTVAGGITAVAGKFTEKDEAFKNVVQQSYETVKQMQNEQVTSGIGIASNREQMKISFDTLLKGDSSNYLNWMTEFASKTPQTLDSLSSLSKTLFSYQYSQDDTKSRLKTIGDTGAALGLGEQDQNMIATALGRLKTTDKTTLEYINLLTERGIPAISYLEEALGKNTQQIYEMISKGQISGKLTEEIMADYMNNDYAGSMEKMSQTYQGLISTLEDNQASLDKAMGDGYIEKRKEGLEAQIEWLGGETGEKMKEANTLIGEWKASLDNDKDKYAREAIEAMMETNEYVTAQSEGDKVKMGELLAQAQVDGENKFKSSAGYQLQLKSDLELIGKIRENTELKSQYWDTGYKMGQEFSKGLAAARAANYTNEFSPSSYLTGNSSSSEVTNYSGSYVNGYQPYAYGLTRVPFNGYRAELHENEMVLTASEARAYKTGKGHNVTITGNSFVVREEADITKIARQLATELSFASSNMTG